MLYEILCDKFVIDRGKETETPRGVIRFKESLNIIQGHNTGTNSIGKSSFLLAIDFAFGGEKYADDKILIAHIGHHTIKFCFMFDEIKYYFSRSTETKNNVGFCDENYNVLEIKTIDEYTAFLFRLYNLTLTDISFRNIVGRYFRIYGRSNYDENLPLASYYGESPEISLIAFFKLYGFFEPILPLYSDVEKKEAEKRAMNEANKRNYIKLITSKRAYKLNINRLEELQAQLISLTNCGREQLLVVDPDQAENAAELKAQIDDFNRQRKRLWAQYYNVKNTSEFRRPATTQDFEELLKYFPNSNLQQLAAIENFHANITTILGEEFAEAMSSTLAQINEIARQIEILQAELDKINLPQRISETTLKSYAAVSKQLDEVNAENDLYEKRQKLLSELAMAKDKYAATFIEQSVLLKNILNAKIEELNQIVGDDISPKLNVLKPNKYEYIAPDDGGTGTRFKNLVLLDLATIISTQLPAFIHDTIIFKQIDQRRMGRIIQLYGNYTEKQIFIAIDETTKYPVEAQMIIDAKRIIQLSEDGNELFGSSWAKRTDNEV